MFNNLLESAKNKRPTKKPVCLAIISLLWVMGLVANIINDIWSYDARLEDRTEIIWISDLLPLPAIWQPSKQIGCVGDDLFSLPAIPVIHSEVSTPRPINLPISDAPFFGCADPDRPDLTEIGIEGGVVCGAVCGCMSGAIGGAVIGTSIGCGAIGQPMPPPPLPPPINTGVNHTYCGERIIHGSPLSRIVPVYPRLAREFRVDGDVKMEITIDEAGNVSEVHIIKGPILLRQEALSALKQWRFSPTFVSNRPVKVQKEVTFRFVLQR